MRILGLSGSLRQGSYNTALLRAAAGLMPEGAVLEVATIRGIPLYDGDLEAAEGIPAAVVALQKAIAEADGLLLVSPEYNNGMPGAFKNAIDWLSRPPAEGARLFGNRPTALIGASPGGFGTIMAQTAWLPVLRALGVDFWSGGRLLVSRAQTLFDASGTLTDAATTKQVQGFMAGFAGFVAARRGLTPSGASRA